MFIARSITVLLFFLQMFCSNEAESQALTQRRQWNGTFQIKMTGSAGLQPVWLDPTEATAGRLLATSLITNANIQRSGTVLTMNNRYKEATGPGNVFEREPIPKSSLLCIGDPNTRSCTDGLLTNTPNTQCPVRYSGPDYEDRFSTMTYPDYDTDLSTFSSSMGQLDIPACVEIETAYLYWTGTYSKSNPNITLVPGTLNSYNPGTGGVSNADVFKVTPADNARKTVKFKIPGGNYTNVNAATTYDDGTRFVCVADVTTNLAGLSQGGQFWVGNLRTYPIEGEGGSCSGWTLVVIYKSVLNPPTLISLWDGLADINGQAFTLSGFSAPTVGNFNSYIGVGALDAEDVVNELTSNTGQSIKFNGGNGDILINQMTEQPLKKLYNKKGYPAVCGGSDNLDANSCKIPTYDGNWCSLPDGALSSQITSYMEAPINKNGNQITRLPTVNNTLGYDQHHIKLPNGAVKNSATSATLTIQAPNNGSASLFMSYIAVEQLQPKLVLSKKADKDVAQPGNKITYKLTVANKGNQASFGGDILSDTLDLVTKYSSHTSTRYVGGAPGAGNIAAPTASNTPQGQKLDFVIPVIQRGDSITINLVVDVLPTSDVLAGPLYASPSCKRTISNIAWINYKKNNAGDKINAKSNSGDCNEGADVKVVITGIDNNKTTLATATGIIGQGIVRQVRKQIRDQNHATSADTSKYLIFDSNGKRVFSDSVFQPGVATATFMGYRDKPGGGLCQDVIEITFTFCTVPAKPAAPVVAPICSGSPVTLTATGTSTGVFFWYNSATGGTPQANPYSITSLNTTTTYYLIDSVLVTKCKSLRTAVVVTVNPAPANPVAPTITSICAGNTTSLNKTGTSTGTFFWFASSTGGSANANPYTTPVLNASTTYYLIDSSTTSKCKSARIAVPVSVSPVPATPVGPASPNICPGSSTILNKSDVAATGTYFWYTKAAGGSPNANAYTTPILNTSTTYYLIDSVLATTCKSARTAVIVNISAVPAKPSAPAVAGICPNNPTTLNKNDVPSTGTYFWYTKATGGAPNANPLTTPSLSTNTTYYLIDSVASPGGCKSARTAVTVNMNQVPGTPAYTVTPICAGSTTVLNKTGTSTGTFFWYTSSTGGSPNANPLTTPALLNNTTYYLIDSSTTTGCKSPRTAVVVQVNPVPANPVAPVVPGICSGSTATFNTTGTPTGKYFWYTKAAGGTPNANPFTSAALAATTTYYLIDSVPSGCKSLRTPVTVNVDPVINPGVIASSASLCASTGFTLTGTLPTGGNNTYTYSWLADNGGGFTPIANTNTQDYTSGGLTVTTKFKRVVTSGTCIPVEGNVVTVTILPGLDPGTIGSDATICYNGNASLTSSASPTGGNGTFSLQWESSPDGQAWNPISAATSSAYSATNLTATILYRRTVTSGTGSCSVASTTPVTITVHPDFSSAGTIAADRGTICSGDVVNISSSAVPVGGTGTYTYAWTISPATSIPANTTADFSNLALSATAKTLYTLTRTATSGTCGSMSTTVDITVNPKVVFTVDLAPIADICSTDPNPVIFTAIPSPTAIGTGGLYEWLVGNVPEASTTNTLDKLPATLVDGQSVYVYLKPGADACPSQPSYTSNTLTLKVASKVIPKVSLSHLIPSCAGIADIITATASSAGSAPVYEWTINDLPDPSTTNKLTYVPANGDKVKVTVISNSNCKSSIPGEDRVSDSLILNVTPLVTPAISINGDNLTPCFGDMVKFDTISRSNGGTFPTYKWYTTNTGVQANATGVSFSTNKLTGTDQVWVEMTSNAECIAAGAAVAKSNLITVTVTPKVTPKTSIFANPGGTICASESITFNIANNPADTANGGSGVTYEWSLNSGSVLGTGPTFTTSTLANNDQVEVKYISSLRCLTRPDDTKTISIKVNNPTVSIAGIFDFCDNDRSSFLTAVETDGADQVTGTGPTYTWTTTGTLTGSGTGPTYPKTDIKDGDEITVTMTPGYTCNGAPVNASQKILVYAKPVIDLVLDDSLICPAEEATFTVSGGPASSYSWTRNSGNLNHNFDNLKATVAGNYTVRVTNVLPNCYTEKSKSLQVENVVVNAGPDRSMFKGEFAILLASMNGKYDITWTPQESVSDPKTLYPVVTPSETTLYTITVLSDNGCSNEDYVLVQVFIPVEVPNAFTPNGDGLNEGWVIKGLEKYPNTKVKIFNRWGGIIHEDKDGYKYPWDGTNNGQPMPTGTYYYVIDLIGSPDNTDKSMTGHLTIIR